MGSRYDKFDEQFKVDPDDQFKSGRVGGDDRLLYEIARDVIPYSWLGRGTNASSGKDEEGGLTM